jgi:insulysin
MYPDGEELFDSHPSRYLGRLIGHEGPGSALAYLKELGLADSVGWGFRSVSWHSNLLY